MALNILDTNGATITNTGTEFEAYDVIRYSEANPSATVSVTVSDSSAADLADELGSVSANVTGSSDDNTITTGAGNDTISGGDGADTLNGGAGDDTIYGNAGNDKLIGGDGNDSITDGGFGFLTGPDGSLQPEVVDIDGGDGDDLITIERFAPLISGTIDGGAGIDMLRASALRGLTIKNVEVLELADFQVSGSSAQFESFDKIAGSTDPVFSFAPSLVVTDSAHLDLSDELGDLGTLVRGFSGIDVKTGDGDDEFAGSNVNDIFDGSGGSDLINGNDGDDKLTGGAGNDTINGGAGIDTAAFTGNFVDYSFAVDDGSRVVTSVLDGTDRLTDVEFARFADGVYNFATETFTVNSPEPGTPLNILDTNGATITKTGAEFEAYDVIRDSEINPLVAVHLVISDSGTVDLSDELGSGSADVTGSGGDNAITTGAGNDTIAGGDGADTLNGGGGNDWINGGAGNDTLNGGDGNDHISGDLGNDVIRGGAGNDTIDDGEIFGLNPEVVDIDAGDGDDSISVGTVAPWNSGTIDGGDGIDTLQAASLRGLTIKNIEVLETEGWSVAGSSAQFESFDKIVWSTDPFGDFRAAVTLTDSVHLDLANELGDLGAFINGDVFGIDVKTGGGDDEFTGTDGNDIFDGSSGNDILNGNAGNDNLIGGAGNDTINGGAGIDTALFAGNFADYSFALNNGDYILTSVAEGTDTLTGVEFARFANGSYDFATETFTSSDTPPNGPLNILDTYGFITTMTGAEFEAYDIIRNSPTEPLSPVILFLSDSGTVDLSDELGSAVADVTDFGGGDSTITTGAGSDKIAGGYGADTLSGGAGNDWIHGGDGNDTLNGGDGSDLLTGGDGDDSLNGGDGDDQLSGNTGNDVIRGGAGNDFISDGELFDVTPEVYDIDGGDGDDAITIQRYDSLASGTIDGGAGIDTLQASTLAGLTIKNIETLQTIGLVEGSSAQFESFDKIIWLTDPFDSSRPSLAVTDSAHLDLSDELGDLGSFITGYASGIDVKTGGGADEFVGTDGNDIFDGSGGNDLFNGRSGDDKLIGGAGIDTAIFSGNFANYSLALNNGDHILTSAEEGTDTLTGIEFARFADGVYDFATETFKLDNTAPTDIKLSKTALSEDTPIWTTVGLLSAKDADGDALTYTLLDGAGDHFRLKGNRIVTSKALDYETDKSHTIKVAVSDGKVTVEKDITINVLDVNEAPVNKAPINLAFSRSSISENVAIGTSVGLLTARDPEGGIVKWRLTDDADGIFKLVGNKIQTKAAIDFESTHSLTFTAEAYDADGNATSHDFTVAVKDVFEPSSSLLHDALI
ncbi:metal-binding protein [Rhizobium hidalgonense]|uniref:metal-binding protein n=1 Tax=Rhizobium hidalgonense TaxID=1538159 RepID=UPI001FCE869C